MGLELFRGEKKVSAEGLVLLAQSFALAKVSEFTDFQIYGKKVRIPYWMNFNPSLVDTQSYKAFPGGGKLTPQEILERTLIAAQEISFNLGQASEREVFEFMRERGIGIDCSGFAYQICKAVYLGLGGVNFEDKVIGRQDKDRGIKRTSASDLTDYKNSIKIKEVFLVKPADIIRCKGGTHVISILGFDSLGIVCAHSSDSTQGSGVHLFHIMIENLKEDIFGQKWDEISLDGHAYIEEVLRKRKEGDGVWRLKVLDQFYRGSELKI